VLGPLLDALFPVRCLGCRGPGGPFCGDCAGRLVALRPPGCARCGRPFEREVERCRDCPPEPIAWSRSAFLYTGPARSALIHLKFSGWRSAARGLGPAFADVVGVAPIRTIRPTITWVPLGRRRKRARGFDQAEALARALGRVTGWPVVRLLARTTETGPQARRSARERRSALEGAFVPVAVPPSFVVLVDDVLTTGATAAACATALMAAGARRVGVLTFARALGGPVPVRPQPRPERIAPAQTTRDDSPHGVQRGPGPQM
jgi:ComF family protein